jgi:hypothetical protein
VSVRAAVVRVSQRTLRMNSFSFTDSTSSRIARVQRRACECADGGARRTLQPCWWTKESGRV